MCIRDRLMGCLLDRSFIYRKCDSKGTAAAIRTQTRQHRQDPSRLPKRLSLIMWQTGRQMVAHLDVNNETCNAGVAAPRNTKRIVDGIEGKEARQR